MLAERDRLALEFAGKTAEIAEDVDGTGSLAAGLGAQRIAGFFRQDLHHLLEACFEFVGNLLQETAALARYRPAPGGKRRLRRIDRAVDVLRVAARDVGDHGARAGRFDGDPATVRRVDPGAVDQHALCSGLGGFFRVDR